MSLSIKHCWKSRPFLMAPYLMNTVRPTPEIPLCCTKESQSVNCSIKFKQWRNRVFGPEHLLAQFKCLIHSASFTIYPIGWLPFGRSAIADVSPAGEYLSDDLDLTVFQGLKQRRYRRGRLWMRCSISQKIGKHLRYAVFAF